MAAGTAGAEHEGGGPGGPGHAGTESVSTALLVVLERLSPAERTAFLLHDVFGFGFEEVAVVVGRTPAAVRQLLPPVPAGTSRTAGFPVPAHPGVSSSGW